MADEYTLLLAVEELWRTDFGKIEEAVMIEVGIFTIITTAKTVARGTDCLYPLPYAS